MLRKIILIGTTMFLVACSSWKSSYQSVEDERYWKRPNDFLLFDYCNETKFTKYPSKIGEILAFIPFFLIAEPIIELSGGWDPPPDKKKSTGQKIFGYAASPITVPITAISFGNAYLLSNVFATPPSLLKLIFYDPVAFLMKRKQQSQDPPDKTAPIDRREDRE